MRKYYREAGEKTRIEQTTETPTGRISSLKSSRRTEQYPAEKHRSFEKSRPPDRKRAELPQYSVYLLSAKERIQWLGFYLILDLCISSLFFRSKIAFLILLPGCFLFLKRQKERLLKKRKEELSTEFQDAIQMMAGSLQSGHSVENALKETIRELKKVYPEDSIIVKEFRFMDTQIAMSRTMEELFLDFGRRSGIEDIMSFAEVFLTAKRSGGNLLLIIRNTAFCIRQKHETLQEIETCLAGKILEQNIMSLVPLFILAYIRISSPGFLDVMYETTTGIAVMTICFLLYLAAYFWGQKMVQIEV